MFVATVITAALLAPALGFGGITRFMQAPMMEENRERLGISPGLWKTVGVLEVLGAVGLVTGLWVPAVGMVAASGLVALMVGALFVHLRNGDGPAGWAPPLVFLALVVTYFVTRAATL